MQIGVGYEFIYEFPQATPLLLTVHIHYSRASDLVAADHLVTVPSLPVTGYRNSFGNWISRIVAPAGLIRLSSYAVVNDTGRPDPVCPDAVQHAVQALPEEICCSCLAAGIAKPIASQRSPGTCSTELRLDGDACRPFATSSTAVSSLAMSTRGRPKLPGRCITSAPGYAGTSPIWQSRCAAA